jgi:hypothetical protein
MKKIQFIAGIVLVFAVLLGCVSCGNGGTEDYKEFEEWLSTFYSGAPGNDALTDVGLSYGDLDSLIDISGYRGWTDTNGGVFMLWTGRSGDDFDNVVTIVEVLVGEALTEDGSAYEKGCTYGSNYYCSVGILLSDTNQQNNMLVPAGTISVVFKEAD